MSEPQAWNRVARWSATRPRHVHADAVAVLFVKEFARFPLREPGLKTERTDGALDRAARPLLPGAARRRGGMTAGG